MKTTLHSFALALLLLFVSAFTLQKPASGKMLMEQICLTRPLLKETLMQAGLSGVLMDTGPYTFFAPSDAALGKYKNTDPGKLKTILMSHVVAGRLLQEDFKDGSKLTTLSGKEVTVFRKGNQLLINGVRVTSGDETAQNGVMHQVENWLVTPN
ncbi:fasciclin domain-containing protein [Adhaeribacter sp. BT258]|uniref:Fasciclin domain-containing protein n=1 Tax=Adhaeribacter terrigena TaxID=2793070 RepID=A0ABS1C2L2_9BACT|nr:fasciclin domain-containing protein [Adhaeribacter terrigena]MBK0403559.1 fasciclin domain-containing protein [Adhaeribacter terrigena]